jgi:hypothetical protein
VYEMVDDANSPTVYMTSSTSFCWTWGNPGIGLTTKDESPNGSPGRLSGKGGKFLLVKLLSAAANFLFYSSFFIRKVSYLSSKPVSGVSSQYDVFKRSVSIYRSKGSS